MGYIYYKTDAPLTPGTYPRIDGNIILRVVNYDDPTPVTGISAPAWGHIEYAEALTDALASDYGLVQVVAHENASTRSDSLIRAQSKYKSKTKSITCAFNMEDATERAVYERLHKMGPKAYIRRLVLADMEQAKILKPEVE